METCLFCLEPTLADNPVISINFSKYPNVCSCRINSHIDCWMIYYLKKNHFECPICHTKLNEGPPLAEHNITVRTANSVIQIRAPIPIIQTRPRPSEEEIRRNAYCLCCGFTTCFVMFIACLLIPVYTL